MARRRPRRVGFWSGLLREVVARPAVASVRSLGETGMPDPEEEDGRGL